MFCSHRPQGLTTIHHFDANKHSCKSVSQVQIGNFALLKSKLIQAPLSQLNINFVWLAFRCQQRVDLLSRLNYQSNFFERMHSLFPAGQLGSTLNISMGKNKCIPRKITNECISIIGPLEGIEDRNIHPENLPTTNPRWAYLHIYPNPRVAYAYPLPPPVLLYPLGRPVRLAGWPDSGGYPTGCQGDSATLTSPGNTLLWSTDSLVAQTR